jgi:hypothetical protein
MQGFFRLIVFDMYETKKRIILRLIYVILNLEHMKHKKTVDTSSIFLTKQKQNDYKYKEI